MKKKIWIICVLAIACVLCGCMSEPSETDETTWTTYVINDKTCRMVYSAPPEEAVEKIDRSEWVGGHYREARVDEEGNFVLTLSEDDIAHWKKEMESNLKTLMEGSVKDNDGSYLKVSDDYHQITTKVQEEYAMGAAIGVQMAMLWCATMQMLNGEDPNDWWVDVTFIDLESGNVVKEWKDFPKKNEGNKITKEDWERARKATTEQSAS